MTALAADAPMVAPSVTFPGAASRTAAQPSEHRGLSRDGVRLLVASGDRLVHTTFTHLPEHLRPGDVVVVNNSATRHAAIDGALLTARRTLDGARPVVVHVAPRLDDGSWVVELRRSPAADRAVLDARAGQQVRLAGGVTVRLLTPYPRAGSSPTGHGNRLWRARVERPRDVDLVAHLAQRGRPIAYGYVDRRYPLADYQTVFGLRPGSAESPSAARPFTPELVSRLVSAGVVVLPVTLHTGLSSQEAGEAPQPEWFEVPPTTAAVVTAARALGGRVVAVGTTVTRALESAADGGVLRPASGWTTRVVSPARPPTVVDGLITGWHDPEASHLLLVEAVAGSALAQHAYDAAVAEGYLWHEFGDSALLLPER